VFPVIVFFVFPFTIYLVEFFGERHLTQTTVLSLKYSNYFFLLIVGFFSIYQSIIFIISEPLFGLDELRYNFIA